MAEIGKYDRDLAPVAANFQPLTPLGFLQRAAHTYPGRVAIVHGDATTTYADFYARTRRLAGALVARGISAGDTVAIMAPRKCPTTFTRSTPSSSSRSRTRPTLWSIAVTAAKYSEESVILNPGICKGYIK